MKRLLVSLSLVLALFTGVSASVQYDTTFGVFLNEIDNIADPIYIFDNQNNVLSFGTRGLNNQTLFGSPTWEFALGMAKGLPLTLGLTGTFYATNEGNPDYTSNWSYTLPALWNGDSNIVATYSMNSYNGSIVSFNLVGGLKLGSMPLGVRLIHYSLNNTSNATFNVNNALAGDLTLAPLGAAIASSTVNEIRQSNTGAFINGTYTLFDKGYADATIMVNSIEAAFKMGNISIYAPLSIILTPMAGMSDISATEYTFNMTTNAVAQDNTNKRSFIENGREWIIGIDPAAYIQFSESFLLWADLSVGMGLVNGIIRKYTEDSIDYTGTPGDTNYNNITNINNYDGYFHLPVALRVGPELYAKAGNLKVGGKFIARGYLDFKTYTDKTVLEQWARAESAPATITYDNVTSYDTTTETLMGLDINIPVGVEYAFNSVFSTRFGASYSYSLTNFTTATGNSYSLDTTTVGGVVTTNGPTPLPGTPVDITTVSGSVSSFQLYFGMGFAFSENFVLDVRASVPLTDIFGSILNLARYDADLRFMF